MICKVRNCLRGEILSFDFSCSVCTKGLYSLIDPMFH